MIDVKEYNLVYYRKSDGKACPARIIETGKISIYDNGETITLTTFKARKLYKASKSNTKSNIKPNYARPMGRNRLTLTKKYREYLKESEEKVLINY